MVNRVKDNILATLAYFDLFDEPLTRSELYFYLPQKTERDYLDQELSYLVAARSVYRFGNFYTLRDEYQLAARRYAATKPNNEKIAAAAQISELLIKFPYVRGIAIWGCVSKISDTDSDIELFIITAKNRLWIARTILQVYKRVLHLITGQNNFCMNYFIDEGRLAVKEQNFQSAVDVVNLTPLQGDTVIEQFYTTNSWTRDYLPNKVMRLASAKPLKFLLFKGFVEAFFNNTVGNAIDKVLMTIITKRWKRSTHNNLIMDASRHYVKADERNYQTALLAQYQSKISEMHIAPQNLLAK